MGESRTELLAWVNDLLQLNYTKVEQAGTGAAYCQIMDTIFNDVHLSKVKFDTKHEYEYVSNFKVLQHSFDKHKIDKIIPVDKLMKCKFQDNLEFMQWVKRFWDQNFPGGEYDAVGRRKGGGGSSGGGSNNAPVSSVKTSNIRSTAARKTAASPAAVKSATPRIAATAVRPSSNRGGGATGENQTLVINDLNKQINELKVTVDGLEKERDFYFGKLREIEILVQEQLVTNGQDDCLKIIQSILYRTEEGFEVPPEEEEEEEEIEEYDDDETF